MIDTKYINNNGRYHHTKFHPCSIIKVHANLLYSKINLIAHQDLNLAI